MRNRRNAGSIALDQQCDGRVRSPYRSACLVDARHRVPIDRQEHVAGLETCSRSGTTHALDDEAEWDRGFFSRIVFRRSSRPAHQHWGFVAMSCGEYRDALLRDEPQLPIDRDMGWSTSSSTR